MGLGAGIEVVVSVFAGLAIGWFLDSQLKWSKPWLTVVVGMLGLATGFYRLYTLFAKSYVDTNREGKTDGKADDDHVDSR